MFRHEWYLIQKLVINIDRMTDLQILEIKCILNVLFDSCKKNIIPINLAYYVLRVFTF